MQHHAHGVDPEAQGTSMPASTHTAAATTQPQAPAPGDAAGLLDLPPELLQLVFSHLNFRAGCGMRAACRAGKTALHGLREHAVVWNRRSVASLCQRLGALRRLAPHLESLTLDLSHLFGRLVEQESGAIQGLQRLVVRDERWNQLELLPAPCAHAVLQVGYGTGAQQELAQAVRNGWRLDGVRGSALTIGSLPPHVLAAVDGACVTGLGRPETPDDHTKVAQFLAALEHMQHVTITTTAACPDPQLLRVATHVACEGKKPEGRSVLQHPAFIAALASGQAPRVRGLTCNISRVPSLTPSLAQVLQELHLNAQYEDQWVDQLLSWPQGLLPALHTLVILYPVTRAVVLRQVHEAALAAAAPALRVIDCPVLVVSGAARPVLRAALPDLQLCPSGHVIR